ncbi:MAG TPA: hypothetical protein VJ836_00410 [Candidatus Saccharimonadales bacterium]|nr:hypothetical protein [Candidatus Saccharimonadales bacterium]
MINAQQRESYRQALEAWKTAAKDAQRVKDRIYGTPSTPVDMYLITDQDLQTLQREADLYQRLAPIARQL